MLGFIIIIVIIIIVLPSLIQKEKDREKKEQREKQRENDEQREKQAEEKAEHYRQMLIQQYMKSPLTKEILSAIGDETGQKPEEIIVRKNCVSSRTNGIVRSYEFLVHRVPELTEYKDFNYEYHGVGDLEFSARVRVYQQDALAKAINKILGEEYSIAAENNGTVVVMRLKPTNNF